MKTVARNAKMLSSMETIAASTQNFIKIKGKICLRNMFVVVASEWKSYLTDT